MKLFEFTDTNLTEATLYSKVRGIVDALNDEFARSVEERMTGKRKTMMALKGEDIKLDVLSIKDPGMRVWTRGDGTRYKDAGYIYVDTDKLKRLQRKYTSLKKLYPDVESIIAHVWEVLKSKPQAQEIGTVSGEFGSDAHEPAMRAAGMLWVKRNNRYIEFSSMSRLQGGPWRHTPSDDYKAAPKKGDLIKIIDDQNIKAKGYKKPITIGDTVEVKSAPGYLTKQIKAINPEKGKVKLSNNRVFDVTDLKFVEPWGYNLK